MTNWDERYDLQDFYYGTAPNAFLVSVVDRLPKGPILSLAEGEGRNAVFLAEQGCRVTAVDGSEVGLRKATRLAADRQVTITTVVADLTEFSIQPEEWDGIVCCYCHLPSDVRVPLHRATERAAGAVAQGPPAHGPALGP